MKKHFEFQGKSELSYEASLKIMAFAMAGFFLTVIGICIYNAL